jgi:signal transduction histidine kinase
MQTLRILCIEDSQQDFALLERSLKKNFELETFKLIGSETELRAALAGERWDLVLSDFNLPGFSALQALSIVKDSVDELPFVLITGAIGEEAVVDFLKFGAQDVVLKSNLARLNFVIERVFRELRIKQRAIDAQRAKEEAIVAREEMLAIVSHDLRNPLTAIQLNAQAIESKVSSGNLAMAQTATINAKSIFRSSMRMKNLIADILDKVRLDAGTFLINKKVMNLKIFLKDVVDVFKPLAEEKVIDFDAFCEGCEDKSMELDFERLFQILSNLIGNALKFTAPYGKITLKFEPSKEGLQISVTDTGQGIAEEQLNKIFDKYWHNERAGRLGVGLGLTIVKEIIEAHGGRIWVNSKKGEGSTFTFILPGDLIVEEKPRDKKKSLNANGKIIVVEDDDDLRDVIESYVMSFGYQVEALSSGKEALEYLKDLKSVPRLAILDYRLTDMTGGEISEALRDKYPLRNIPVIFLSAETHLDSIAQKYKASTFLTKPLGMRDLKQAIEKYIDA